MSNNKKKHPLLMAAGLALGCMAGYNYSESRKATANNINHNEECRIYNGRFGNISYKHYGSGSPMLLIPGLNPAASMAEWIPAAKALSRHHSVYIIDLPGCGFSDKRSLEYTAYMYALAINDFVHNRICRSHDAMQICAVASSASAPLLICAASLNASLYSNICLVNPKTIESCYCNPTTNPTLVKLERLVCNTPIVGSFIYNVHYSRNNILSRINTDNPSLTEEAREELADSMYEASHIGGFTSKFLFSSIMGNLLSMDISRIISKLTVDTCIIAGADNKQVKSKLSTFDNDKENISTIMLDGINTPQLECPDRLAAIINELITD